MKILILLNRVPFPLNDGGAIGSYQFVKGYADAGAAVHCLAMNTSKHFVDAATIREEFSFAERFETIAIDNHIRPIAAFFNLFTDQSYIISRFWSAAYDQKLRHMLHDHHYDIVHIDGLPPGLYIDSVRQCSTAKIVQRAHNVEYRIWQRGADEATNPLKKWYLGLQSARLRHFEAESLSKVDTVLSISREDDAAIKALHPAIRTYIVPAGMVVAEEVDSNLPQEFSLAFIGSFDWLPNTQGLDWFIANCWDEIHRTFPTLKFYIAGKKMPDRFRTMGKNIVAAGEVSDAKKFITDHSMLLVPLVSGSGVRIKIIEAFALGRAVLATSIAAEGSGAVPDKEILLADDTANFIAQLEKVMADQQLLLELGKNAHRFALHHYQNKAIMQRLLYFYDQLIQTK